MRHDRLINCVELANQGRRFSAGLRLENGRSAFEAEARNAATFVKSARVRDNAGTGSRAREQPRGFGR